MNDPNVTSEPPALATEAAEISLQVGVDKDAKQVVLLLEITGDKPVKACFNYTAKEAAGLAGLIARCAQEALSPVVAQAQPKLAGKLSRLVLPPRA